MGLQPPVDVTDDAGGEYVQRHPAVGEMRDHVGRHREQSGSVKGARDGLDHDVGAALVEVRVLVYGERVPQVLPERACDRMEFGAETLAQFFRRCFVVGGFENCVDAVRDRLEDAEDGVVVGGPSGLGARVRVRVGVGARSRRHCFAGGRSPRRSGNLGPNKIGKRSRDRERPKATLSALANEYGKHHRWEILDAVDAARLDGGFANDVCSFYAHILSDPAVVARYRRDIRPLARCAGISLSPSEVARVQSVDHPDTAR